MKKLWQKETVSALSDLQSKIETFTIGSDKQWDLYLAEADVLGSMAHAEMLASIDLLTQNEFLELKSELHTILDSIKNGSFAIEAGVEDVHSQIEILLTQTLGDVGKKIHSGRSRNDQSLVDIKLFIKKEIEAIASLTKHLFDQLISLSNEHKSELMPGYTHMQIAMPSSFGLWFGAYAESLSDDLELLIAAYNVTNKNPLGSGAGYGSSFPLDRQKTTKVLGFEGLNYNVVYAQMTRGKTEKITAVAIAGIAATLSKFSMDVCLYMNQNFGFITFPQELTTGSSIMPHKKNPDVFELIRAKCNRIQSLPNELTLLINNLPSGYHRDMQLTKECLFPALIDFKDCLELTVLMLENIVIKKDILKDEMYKNLFTVEKVNELTLSGIPFREAYKQVAQLIEDDAFDSQMIVNHTHQGSIGNLCNEEIAAVFNKRISKILE
ncbi:argininosuccinate lyase [Flavobacterium tegetincola]|uniref:argininosuccinate lyase n=1 Tax=Flavobacterium tegetincola TaxID=150172 RepID=UPI00042300AA|nr:argininosuccinate lyase [Flavobacterium tegetincola]